MMPTTGQEFSLGKWVIEKQFVDDYLRAAADGSSIYSDLRVAPPMALAARAIGALLIELSLPPGTMHASQEIDCKRMVNWGEEVTCVAKLSRAKDRGNWRFVSAEFTLSNTYGETLMSGKSTVLVPVDGE